MLSRHPQLNSDIYLIKPPPINRSDLNFENLLRAKFVETAKKYIGIPYNKKYLSPSSPLFSSPIFLDCCGLIRQCVYDLRYLFGFQLGPWNQAYQYDTLMKDIKEDELKEGDLIFYSGRYYDKKRRRHQHDMVHVEMVVSRKEEGGIRTIAARKKEGAVEIFEDYKFKSSTYYNVRYHFKSIDVWLKGVCRSHCKKHGWKEFDGWWMMKYALFNDFSSSLPNLRPISSLSEESSNKIAYIHNSGNDKLIKMFFKSNNWTILNKYDREDPSYLIKWVNSSTEINYDTFREGEQFVNHFPNSQIIVSRLRMLELSKYLSNRSQNFLFQTFKIDNIQDYKTFSTLPPESLSGVWMYKNLTTKKIRLISDLPRMRQDLAEKKDQIKRKASTVTILKMSSTKTKIRKKIIITPNLNNIPSANFKLRQFSSSIQKKGSLFNKFNSVTCTNFEKEKEKEKQEEYVFKYKNLSLSSLLQKFEEEPLTLDGKKCQMRCYIVVLCSDDFKILFHHGFIKVSLEKFRLDEKTIEDQKQKHVFLLDSNRQRKHPHYERELENTCISMNAFEQYLVERMNCSISEIDHLYKNIKFLLLEIFDLLKKEFLRKRGIFEIFSCDFSISDKLHPKLLEIGTNPAFIIENKIHLEFFPFLFQKIMNLLLLSKMEGFENLENKETPLPQKSS